ncbi:hypothetical protein [uncultured Microscilla sp.]|uniref:hypothetical protein n=1 Tax=uncultured Microscilla sp. TaxID=432653 RepID=UPI002607057D|nr:hypothetical protein [uncultured Microscilla sp.]
MKKHLFVIFACTLLASFTAFGQSKLKPKYKGYDIFSAGSYVYVVRSDIGYFLRARRLDGASTTKSEIFPLNEALSSGIGYFGLNRISDGKLKGTRCVVRGTMYSTYRNFGRTKGQFKDIGSEEAQDGDHYFAVGVRKGNKPRRIYVIKGNKFYRFKSLKDKKPEKGFDGVALPKELQTDSTNKDEIVAIWGRSKFIYVLKNTEFGPLIYRTSDLRKPFSTVVSAPNDGVRKFLIGGLTAEQGGKTSVVWKSISGAFPFCNTSSNQSSEVAAPKVSETITVGFVKGSTSSIEKNWSITATVGMETGGLGALVASAHAELSTTYGGASVKTKSKEWSTQNTTTVNLDEGKLVKGGQCIGYWQGQMFINNKLIMTTGIYFTDTKSPPEEEPAFFNVK